MKNHNLKKIISNILVPLAQVNRVSRRRKVAKEEGNKGKLNGNNDQEGLLAVKRLKTLAEVDEDEENKSNYEFTSQPNLNN